jgi:long-chain acyl-CoA synthetase
MTYIPTIRTLADAPRYHAEHRPNEIALMYEGRETNYRDWDQRCTRVANGLIALGIKPKGRVAFLDKNSDYYFDVLFGTAKAGACLVAVNWRLAPPEVAYIIGDSNAEVLFTGRNHLGLVKQILPELTKIRRVIVIDGPEGDWPDFVAWQKGQSAVDPMLEVSPSDVIVQMYTSGTTGHPKGVQLSHFALYAHDKYRAEHPNEFDPGMAWNDWGPNDVSLVTMPVFHISGTGWGIIGLYNGARSIVLSQFDPGEVLSFIEEHRVTKLVLVPTAIHQLLLHPKCKATDFSSIETLLYGASPIPLDLLRQAIETLKCGFVQLYGMTETAGAVTYLPAEDHDPKGTKRMRSAGKPIPGVKLSIRDGDGKPMPTGAVGEIWLHSATRMNGYWNLPEATAKTITADGWVKSGDAGYLDDDGYVYVHDRVKDMIVSGGENIYPAEVESAIFGHPDVQEVAVIGVPDQMWGEAVRAVVVPKAGHTKDAQSILDFARQRIAGYKVPKAVDFVSELPRNASGKILKRELRKPYWEGRERQVN